MSDRLVLSLVLNAHVPFANHPEVPFSTAEHHFFELLSDTYIPLLNVLSRLEADHVPYRIALAISPTLCQMLRSERLLSRYSSYLNARVEFGSRELERTRERGEFHELARVFYEKTLTERTLFYERYEKDILKAFAHYQKKGRVELLATAATHAFLPFYTDVPEAIKAQIEVAMGCYNDCFEKQPMGFWLPDLGWAPELDSYIRSYNLSYTIVSPHGLIIGNPSAKYGNFYPVKTPQGTFILGRDYNAHLDFWNEETGIILDPLYLDQRRDVGYELSIKDIFPFLSEGGGRTAMGYKYWANGVPNRKNVIYSQVKARERLREHTRYFLDTRAEQLTAARKLAENPVISLCACNAGDFGHTWHEGIEFIETLFREAAARKDILFMNPGEYLFKRDTSGYQTMTPEFSSWGINGYAEAWLDASNDWIYRHIFLALDRMAELVDRFPNDTGLKERSLNQAARELLLVQESVWPLMMGSGEEGQYARNQVENSLRNFTTIYESMGSNYISTEWLTSLERQNNVFPNIKYQIFKRKKQ